MSRALFDLTGRTALITGSARGLGRAFAEGLAEAGARVVINGTTAAGVDKTVAELTAKGHAALAAAFNVTDEAAVVSTFERFDREGVAVDVLINNAGIQLRKPLVELSLPEWQKVIDTNLTSAFLVAREAGKRMIPRKRGKIINIGSLMSHSARATVGPYTAAKGGIKLLTQTMVAEWAQHGIQANAIGPGYMLTDMNQALVSDQNFNAWVVGRVPQKRWGRPEELVGAAVFLSSPASDYINGQIIYVDGGMLAVL